MASQTVDVLVIGGGMSGLSAATTAAEAGAKVLLVEKGDRTGGSAQYSAGMVRNCSSCYSTPLVLILGDSSLQREI
jgi:phytoene dehydrogenase-like protein